MVNWKGGGVYGSGVNLDVNLFQILNFSCTPLANQTKQKSPPNSKPAKDINLW